MNRGEYTTEIYDLLYFCDKYNVGKEVLDCGAGGNYPKLAYFAQKGYDLYGIDSSEEALENAKRFAQKNNIEINFKKADIRDIPYQDESFDVVFSYNTIFHMRKVEIKKAVNEIIRVLKTKGMGYINFIDIEDDIHRTDKEESPGEFISSGEGYHTIHTLLTSDECEEMLVDVKILEKQRKFISCLDTDYPKNYTYLDYFFQK
jgi:ubiquinone/menaquinone biosynthesis C-methylase UbiE